MTIYLCYGCRKSGSTLAYELTCELLRRAGHPQDRLPGEILDLRHRVNFIDGRTGLTVDLLKRIESAVPPGRIIALKTHQPPSTDVFDHIRDSGAYVQAVYRDPRDNVLSLRDAGRKARHRGEHAFAHIRGTLDAISECESGLADFEAWAHHPETLIADYDEVAFDSRKFLARITRQIGLAPLSEQALVDIEQEAKGQRFTQFNKGVTARHRREFTVSQYAALTRHFGAFLNGRMPDRLDDLDMATIAEADTQPQCGEPTRALEALFPPEEADMTAGATRTEKTFVVLGCPRGGTSLIAGALYHCGVSMGNFRTGQYEDPDFKVDPKKAGRAARMLRPKIQARNRTHEYWGWKVPNAIYYIDGVRRQLINPVFIMIYRAPLAIARSSARHDNVGWTQKQDQLLRDAERHTAKLKAFEKKIRGKGDLHVFRHEEIQADPETFIDRLVEIVSPLNPSRDEIRRFINREGGYRMPEALPHVDYLAAAQPHFLQRARSRLRTIRKSL